MDLTEIQQLLPGDRNYILESATVVSPYLSWSFIKAFIDRFGDGDPSFKINLIIDQNCPRSAIKEVMENLEDKQLGVFRISKANGLVHAKLYWLDFYRLVNGRRRHRKIFILGSLNATKGGWEHNSEVAAAINLHRNEHQKERGQITAYFSNLIWNQDIPEQTVTVGVNKIFLPAMKLADFKEDMPTSADITFDIWLQKGILAHAYKNERFARFEVRLEASPQGNIRIPGWEIQETRTITFGYTGIQDGGGRGEPWRSRYFIDTIYGPWTSIDCFDQYGDDFIRGGFEVRRGHLEYVKRIGTEISMQDVVARCMSAVQELLKNQQIGPLLRKTTNGGVDVEFYRRNCIQQVENHTRKSGDETFIERYVNGFEFSELPPLLEYESLWQEFLASYFETMLYGIRNRGEQNPMGLIARVIKDWLELDGEEEWPDVYNDVVELWCSDGQFKENLMRYNEE